MEKLSKQVKLMSVVSIVVIGLCVSYFNIFLPLLNFMDGEYHSEGETTYENLIETPASTKPPEDIAKPVQIDDAIYQVEDLTIPELAGLVKADSINILMIGADQEDDGTDGRFDTIVICSINKADKTIDFISLPRDTYIKYDKQVLEDLRKVNPAFVTKGKSKGIYKLNATYFVGETIKYQSNTPFKSSGMNFFHDIIKNKYGIELVDYIHVNFSGFREIVDAMDGLDMNIEHDIRVLHEDTGAVELVIHKGMQHLDGQQALIYARTRKLYNEYGKQIETTGDNFRKQIQLKMLLEISKQMVTPDNILRFPAIMDSLRNNIHHSINTSDITKYSDIAMAFTKGQYTVKTYLVTGVVYDPWEDPDADYVVVD